MTDFLKQHKILSGIVLLLLIGAAWWEFTGTSSTPTLVTTAGPAGATSTQDAELVSTLLQLQTVTLSGTILSSPAFLSLQDFTTQVVTEPVGRPNPFAPLTSGSTAGATSTAPLDPNLFAPAKQ